MLSSSTLPSFGQFATDSSYLATFELSTIEDWGRSEHITIVEEALTMPCTAIAN